MSRLIASLQARDSLSLYSYIMYTGQIKYYQESIPMITRAIRTTRIVMWKTKELMS